MRLIAENQRKEKAKQDKELKDREQEKAEMERAAKDLEKRQTALKMAESVAKELSASNSSRERSRDGINNEVTDTDLLNTVNQSLQSSDCAPQDSVVSPHPEGVISVCQKEVWQERLELQQEALLKVMKV